MIHYGQIPTNVGAPANIGVEIYETDIFYSQSPTGAILQTCEGVQRVCSLGDIALTTKAENKPLANIVPYFDLQAYQRYYFHNR